MTAANIIMDARVAHVRELKTELAKVKARLVSAESDRDVLVSHFALALTALHDFERLPCDAQFCIIDGWNAILHNRNVSKLSSENVSKLKAEFLQGIGIVHTHDAVEAESGECCDSPIDTWVIFDGADERSSKHGRYRISYTGGVGSQRADRLIVDYVHAAKILGLDVSRITVKTSDKELVKKVTGLGAVCSRH